MGIHEDAWNGTLIGTTLTRYLKINRNILEELSPITGYAPLAAAAVAGFADVVDQLLEKGAKAEVLSRDGETALLLSTRQDSDNRPRIVQLLLSKIPRSLVDATTAAQGRNTPLMFAVRKKDLECIRLLVKAGASPMARNSKGETPEAVAASDPNKVIKRALDPVKEQAAFTKLTDLVGSFMLYIVSWVNETAGGLIKSMFGLSPTLDTKLDEKVNPEEETTVEEFRENVDKFLERKENAVLSRFFKEDPTYLQDLAKNATELAKDKTTPLGNAELLPKMIKLTLRQQVIYCDDSSSMRHEGRWAAQAQLVKRIARITTRVLPEGEGVSLRFINQSFNNLDNLNFQAIGQIIDGMSWKPRGNTPIGTYLKARILEPMVYSQLRAKTLKKPYLISIMTDGMPSEERNDTLVEVIKECGVTLTRAGYPIDTVLFLVGQIGTGRSTAAFLQTIKDVDYIKPMVHVTSDQLDKKFAEFKSNEGELDTWLLKMLYSPIKGKSD